MAVRKREVPTSLVEVGLAPLELGNGVRKNLRQN